MRWGAPYTSALDASTIRVFGCCSSAASSVAVTSTLMRNARDRAPDTVRRSVPTPLAALGVALAWSGGWIAGKLGGESAPPLEFSAIRFVIASGALAIIVVATRTHIRTDALGPVVLAAMFGYLGYSAFVFIGLTMAPASDAALIVPTTIPVLTAIAASFFGERVTTTKVAGFALASIGAALVIAAGQTGGEVSSQRLLGDVLLLVGAVCWSIYTVLGTITLRTRSPIEVVALAAAIGA